jgi:transposase
MAYSIDLRERVLAFYDDGHSQQETIATFRISQSALNSWLRLRKETGNLEGKLETGFFSKFPGNCLVL